MDEGILQEFLAESYEYLEQVERDLVVLERDPGDRQKIAGVFRAFHTIKGTCGFFGFTKLASVTHAGESLLSELRSGERRITPDVATELFALVDTVRAILGSIKETREEGDGDFGELIDRLRRLQAPRGDSEAAQEPPAPPLSVPPDGGLFAPLIESGRLTQEAVAAAAQQQRQGDPRRLGEILVDHGVLQPQDILQALLTRSEAAASSMAESSIHVDVELLDHLMNLVGELVLARNQLLLRVASRDHADLPGTAQRLNHITTELQERMMKTRMQPIGNLCSKLPRLVRDVTAACGKEARLELEGLDTELDRTILDAIRDPITHIIRNAIDHGIEAPAVRRERGKSPEGRIRVRAFHEGGKVHIEIADDGAGLSLARIREKALAQRLIPPDRVGRMTDRDWANVVFLPGFSTAEHVTNVSGRGVGMDVVRTNVERIGGTIDVESKATEGTTVRIRIPLTLAIIPALIVASGGERYAIPQVNLIELVRIEAVEASVRLANVYGARLLYYRDGLLPLVDLREVLQIPPSPAAPSASDGGAISIIVLHADEFTFGLVVERIDASQEIVVKPLGDPLRQIAVFAGATILGDGRVSLILDVPGLARLAGITPKPVETAPAPLQPKPVAGAPNLEAQTLIVCRAGEKRNIAIPQHQIARLEEFPRRQLERIGDRAVVQYRGGILPLVSLGAMLDLGGTLDSADMGRLGPADPLRAVVHERDGVGVGLVVESIVEVVEERIAPLSPNSRSVFAGAAIVRGTVTELLDLDALFRTTPVGRDLRAVPAGAKE